MPGQQYEMVPEYDSLEGLSQGDTKVVNMFRYYESEDTRYMKCWDLSSLSQDCSIVSKEEANRWPDCNTCHTSSRQHLVQRSIVSQYSTQYGLLSLPLSPQRG